MLSRGAADVAAVAGAEAGRVAISRSTSVNSILSTFRSLLAIILIYCIDRCKALY